MASDERIADVDREVQKQVNLPGDQRRWLTVRVRPLTPEMADALSLPAGTVQMSLNGERSEFGSFEDACRWLAAFMLKLGHPGE